MGIARHNCFRYSHYIPVFDLMYAVLHRLKVVKKPSCDEKARTFQLGHQGLNLILQVEGKHPEVQLLCIEEQTP